MRGLLLALVLGACGGSPPVSAAPQNALAADSMVALVDEEGRSYCAGTMLQLERVILTAAHCVEGEASVEVALYRDLSEDQTHFLVGRSVRVLRIDHDADLATLSLPRGYSGLVRLAGHDPVPGEPIVLCGHPVGLTYVCDTGHVSGGTRHGPFGREGFFVVDAGIYFGHSGGPTFDQNGDLLGVNSFFVGTPILAGIVSPDIIRTFLSQ